MENQNKLFMNVAKLFASQSTCVKRQVGSILVKDQRILSTGYNGTPTGFCNCNEIFQNKDGQVVQRKNINFSFLDRISNHHEFAESFEIHAEQNCLSFAAKNGIRTKNCTLYVTTAPCVNCAKIIIACGIKKVVYLDNYKNEAGLDLLKIANINCEKFREN